MEVDNYAENIHLIFEVDTPSKTKLHPKLRSIK